MDNRETRNEGGGQSDRLEFDGEVIEASNSRFRVKISETHTALCVLSGKIRQNYVRIVVGDRVKVEVSPFEPTKGRIVFRYKVQ
jgi:translation initiation factor IF-1